MFEKKGILFLMLLVFMVFLASTVSAQTYSPNLVQGGSRWKITAYKDCANSHNELGSQQICFYYIGKSGTCDNYIWWSCTFPGWNGRAVQEGDQIFMHGDFGYYEHGRDAIQWQILSTNLGAGHWQEWKKDGQYGDTTAFANAKLERLGYYCTCSSMSSMSYVVDLTLPGAEASYVAASEDKTSPMQSSTTGGGIIISGEGGSSDSPL